MKRIYLFFVVLIFMTTNVFGAISSDVKVLESSLDIRQLSQKISVAYMLLYKYPHKYYIKKELNDFLSKLDRDFKNIARSTKDSDSKDILGFLAYSKEQISEIINGKLKKEKVAIILDYSETLLEGADSITRSHIYDFSDDEKMIRAINEIDYLLERINKYYLAINIGFSTTINKEKFNQAINNIDKEFDKIKGYKYPKKLVKKQQEILKFWTTSKLYLMTNNLFIPNLLYDASSSIEDGILQLTIYHSKNE